MLSDDSHDAHGDGGIMARTGRLLRAWWRADRVRVSPREGKLLRLQPPCIVRVGRTYVQVLKRCVGQTDAGPYVRYDCLLDDQPAQLMVTLTAPSRTPPVTWTAEDKTVHCDVDDIEVFG